MRIGKIKLAGAYGDLAHNGRVDGYTPDENSKSKIDATRTGRNYAIDASGQRVAPDALQRRGKAMLTDARNTHVRTTGRKVRKDAVGMISTIVTLPRDWPADQPVSLFFTIVHEWARDFWKPQRLIGSFVHLDETTPHAHIDTIPLVDDKLNANKLMTRAVYRNAHDSLQDYVDKAIGCHVSIKLDDDDAVGKALSSVPHDKLDAVKQAFDQRQQQLDAYAKSLYAYKLDLDERENQLKQREIACGLAEYEQAHPAPLPVSGLVSGLEAPDDKKAPEWSFQR